MTEASLQTALSRVSGDIVLAGAGKMGGAMLTGWLANGVAPSRIAVIEPMPSPELRALEAKGLRLNPQRNAVGQLAALIVAIKPQMFTEAVPALAKYVSAGTLIVSIMAGTKLAALATLGSRCIVRTMPNLPASIGRGMTVAVPTTEATSAQRAFAHALLAATGAVDWVDDEPLMDAVTAVSGSGPAYLFLLTEELARAGVAAGLPEALAKKLARETMSGAGELLRQSDLDAAELRKNVTSPGGTTAAALDVLMAPGAMADLMTRAIAAATKRSKDLAK